MARSLREMMGGVFGQSVPPRVRPTKTEGSPGFSVYGGYIDTKERSPKVVGAQKWQTYSDIAVNTSIVAAAVRQFLGLVARTGWSVEPARDIDGEESSDAAKEAAAFVESVIHDMVTPWGKVARKASMYRFHGFGVQEWTARRRDDGRFGFRDIVARPQHTIDRWLVDDAGAVTGVVQTSPQTGREITLPRNKLVYLVDDSFTDSPEGLGIFRHLVDPYDQLREYLRLEKMGYQRDLRGIPIGRAPFQAINKAVNENKLTKEDADKLIKGLESAVKMQAKSHETGIILDSQPYENAQESGVSVSSVAQWGLELLTGNANGIEYLGNAVDRLNREMARIMGAEHLMLGDGSGGNRALSEDKSRGFFLMVEGALADIADAAEKDVIGPLWWLNGLPDELKPTMKHEKVQFRDVKEITAGLRDMATAGATLAPDDPAVNDVRDLWGISRAPEMDPALMGANDGMGGEADPGAEGPDDGEDA